MCENFWATNSPGMFSCVFCSASFFSASINLLKTAATIIDPKKSLTTKWEYISRAIKVTLWRQRYRLSDHLFMHSSDFVGGRFVHFASEFHLSIIYVKLPEFTTQYIFYVNNIISSVNIIMVSLLNILDRSAKNDNFHDNKWISFKRTHCSYRSKNVMKYKKYGIDFSLLKYFILDKK